MLELDRLLTNPPKLHDYGGTLISDWRIDDFTCRELSARLSPQMKTMETGAGLSTIIFAASGCDHTCIVPDSGLVDRIKNFCRDTDIDLSPVHFVIAKSCDVIHQFPPLSFDLVLIDGCHGFPSIFVDFCYASKALKIGGVLILDDMHIYTCHQTALFMQSDAGWKIVILNKRFVLGIKLSDTIDYEWTSQPFVISRRKYSNVGPLFMAKLTVKSVVDDGLGTTIRKIVKRALMRLH